MKRENGSGSIVKRKDKKYRPYLVRLPSKWTADGETREILGSYKTLKEAKEALAKYLENPTDYPNMTFAQAYDKWSDVAFRNISKSSVDGYKASYKKCSAIADMKLRDIRTEHLQSVIDEHESQSNSSLTKLKVFLKQILDFGMQEDVITKNYSDYIVLPKAQKQEKEFFSDVEIKKISEAVGKVEYADYILCMIYTGFRISEFLELTVFSYSEERNTLKGGAKTEAGRNRIIPVHDNIRSLVQYQVSLKGSTLFCRKDNHRKMSDKYFREKCYYPALEQIGVRPLNPHCTRHTFATLLAGSGVKPEYAQKLMGHSKYSMTADVYIHADEEALKNELSKLA